MHRHQTARWIPRPQDRRAQVRHVGGRPVDDRPRVDGRRQRRVSYDPAADRCDRREEAAGAGDFAEFRVGRMFIFACFCVKESHSGEEFVNAHE